MHYWEEEKLKFNREGVTNVLSALYLQIEHVYTAATALSRLYEENNDKSFTFVQLRDFLKKELDITDFDASERLDDLQRYLVLLEEDDV